MKSVTEPLDGGKVFATTTVKGNPIEAINTSTLHDVGHASSASTNKKREPLAPDLDRIPDDLKELDIWVCFQIWHAKDKKGNLVYKLDGSPKFSKFPIDPKTGKEAKCNISSTWGSFDQAVEMMNSRADITGLGIGTTASGEHSVIDCDSCIDEAGKVNEETQEIITRIGSLVEVSPSSRGIHIILKGKISRITTANFNPEGRQSVEIFCSSRFCTITGIPVPEYEQLNKIEQRDTVFKAFYKDYAGEKEKKSLPTTRATGLRDVDTFETILSDKIIDFDAGVRKEFVSDNCNRGWQWEIECPWKHEHTGGEGSAFITYFETGTCGFHCFHSHCKDAKRNYKSLVEKFDLPAVTYIDEFNAKHAVIEIAGKVVVLNEKDDIENPVTFSSQTDFMFKHANKINVYTDDRGNKTVSELTKLWIRHPDRRTYDGVVFKPGAIMPYDPGKENTYNLFKGWSIKQSKEGSCALFLKHVFDNICGGNQEHYVYLTSWNARMFQDPGSKRPGVSVVIRGDKGTGKGFYAEVLMHLMRPYSFHVAQTGALTCHFNKWLMNKLLVCADEAFFAGAKTDEGQLKHLISDKNTMITPKGFESFIVENFVNFLMISNSDWAVPASSNERRWFILDILSKCQQNTKYFGAIQDQLDNGGYERLMDYYMNYKYDKDLLRNPPLTQGLIDQKMHNLSPVESFWYHCLENATLFRADETGELMHENHTDGDWGSALDCHIANSPNLKIDRQQVYYYFTKIWCRDMRKKYTMPLNAFINDLAHLCPGVVNARHRPPKGGGRKPYFVVEPLFKCEQLWKEKLQGVDKSNHVL